MGIIGGFWKGWLPHTLSQEASGGDAPLKQRGQPDTELERGNRKLAMESKKESLPDYGEEKSWDKNYADLEEIGPD